MKKKIFSAVLAFSLLASSLGGFGVTSVKESRATEKKDEYLIQADSPAVYGQLCTEMEKKDSEVVKHTEEDEAYLAENKAMVVSLTKAEAAELEKEQGITVEKDATVRGASIEEEKQDGLIYAEPEEIDMDALPKEDEYTTDATKFEPREDVTDPDKIDEVVPWNISCVAGTPHENQYKGKKVKVAVLDSGIDMHDELYTKQWIDFSDTVNGYKPTDNSGHGTTIAGPIAARISGFGMEGIASEAELYSVKILNKENEASVSTVVKAIEWCIQNDMDIINMSFGMDSYSEILADAVKKAYNNDILMIAAAGNNVKQVQYPARFPEVLSVGSINSKLETSEFSDNSQTDLAAPGEDVQSIGFLGSYTKVSGTSLAAAHVTGVAAAVKSVNTSFSAGQLMEVLKGSAISLGDDGRLVNYENAVALAKDKENLPTVTKADVAETVQEKAEDEECYVKGSWSTEKWNGIEQSHKSLVNQMPLGCFGSGEVTSQTEYRNVTAIAVQKTDTLSYMSASKEGNYGRDNEGNILSSSADKMYSPYHAKSEYTLAEVQNHLLFLYELARRRIVLEQSFSTIPANYSGNSYHTYSINQKMKRRIIADLVKMRTDVFGNCVHVTNNSDGKAMVRQDGYMILGVFLHLVQDLQAHRAEVKKEMVFEGNAYTSYHPYDIMGDGYEDSHISGVNRRSDSVYKTLYSKLSSGHGIAMIDLKDYLKETGTEYTSKFIITIGRTSYYCSAAQAYEDNPYFYKNRFYAAQLHSQSYIGAMVRDTSDTSNRPKNMLTSSQVPLV